MARVHATDLLSPIDWDGDPAHRRRRPAERELRRHVRRRQDAQQRAARIQRLGEHPARPDQRWPECREIRRTTTSPISVPATSLTSDPAISSTSVLAISSTTGRAISSISAPEISSTTAPGLPDELLRRFCGLRVGRFRRTSDPGTSWTSGREISSISGRVQSGRRWTTTTPEPLAVRALRLTACIVGRDAGCAAAAPFTPPYHRVQVRSQEFTGRSRLPVSDRSGRRATRRPPIPT